MENFYLQKTKNYLSNLGLPELLKRSISFEQFAEKNPSYYLNYPMLFADIFELENSRELDLLCIAGSLYYRSMISLDQLYDEDIDKSSAAFVFTPLVISTCQEETIKILSSLFDLDSDFWSLWNQRKKEFLEAMLIERDLNENSSFFDLDTYHDLSEKKSALGKIAVDSLFLLSEKKFYEDYKKILEAHKYFSIALQYNDDFQDFKEDKLNNQVNWLVQRLNIILKEEGIEPKNFSTEYLNKYMYIKGVASESLHIALDFYNKALKTIAKLRVEATLFKKVINEKIIETRSTIVAIEQYTLIYKKKVELFNLKNTSYLLVNNDEKFNNIKSEVAKALIKLINLIISDANQNFFDIKHIMYLGPDEGFENKEVVHVGDVFQRGILLDILCDISSSFEISTVDSLIKDELEYLLNQRLKHGLGGWSYFPSVKEIAPDSDDLGQILQCFSRTNKFGLIESHVAYLLDVIFSGNYHNLCGGFETWIIPHRNRTKLQETQNYFNETKWGKGPDIEVVANLLYGISISPFNETYNQHVHSGVEYLLKQQHELGYWNSRWYYGQYYGTYACLRLFRSKNIYNDTIHKSIDFIINSQNHDGSWNTEIGKQGILDTSFALLCLSLYPENVQHSIKNGLKYLVDSTLSKRELVAESFILPKAGQPYKSKTITAGYIIKAIVNNLNSIKA